MSQIPFQITIGVDIAKKNFDVASLIDGKYKHKMFANYEPHPTRYDRDVGHVEPTAARG